MADYIPPARGKQAFNCAKCRVFAKQDWFYMNGSTNADGYGGQMEDRRFLVSRCEQCKFPTIWLGETMIFPGDLTAEPPNSDMPPEIARDYNEARAILGISSRGAAALLRLGIQKLCV